MASAAHLRDLLIFLLDTGARLSEAAQLTWRDVKLDRKPRGMVKFMVTKSGLPRSVPLTKRVEQMLSRLKQCCPEGEARVFLHRQTEAPPNWWTPLLSSEGSGKVSNGPGTASIYR